ncbi:MAG: ACP S-malonyltransferase [Anaerovoracaceae bacterium]
MKIGITFVGQGAQYPGMGKDLYENSQAARKVFDLAGDQVKEWCFNGDEETLRQTHITQPCIYTVTMAAYEAFKEAVEEAGIEKDLEMEGLAGFSLGEYAALTAAGSIDDIKKGMDIVTKRGKLMTEAGMGEDGQPRGGMAAAMGKRDRILDVVDQARGDGILEGVNFNSPTQTVVAGDKETLEKFVTLAKENKIKAKMLSVSTAFHSPMMVPAAETLKGLLEDADLKKPDGKIYANVTSEDILGEMKPGENIGEYLAEIMSLQAMNPVYWEETIRNFAENKTEVLVEIGPGTTLSGLTKKIAPKIERMHIDSRETLKETIESLKAKIQGDKSC